MSRTTILYDGIEYVVALTADDVKAKIAGVLATGEPGWITVNHGRGKLQAAEILICAGIPISLIDTSDPAE
ncbi:hypothetical protein M2152_002773 [Microbacteriaceae bacterium SG_E_30_P1]|uniref:Uncharacterized protein n=1 Tax=Antiquaquibacter oligotrophicus TaxID=2880260 RepID=A0ABT6KRV6_9MICO|nr:hypothetical protein [Antiquaquibacter oligotrophicus]MDH6182591.1 hypothetical protein [Antiquaquibacter oligotrophicus]UDF14443.1 hypothetical protein LH407_06170 [Antiquaquibacter oligotrophicus]